MKTTLIYVLALVALYAAGRAQAADYYWTLTGYTDRFGSARAACDAFPSLYDPSAKVQNFTKISDVYYTCTIANPNDGPYRPRDILRGGDSCPAKTTLNPETGACDPEEKEPEDPCSAKAGQSTPFSKSGTGPDGYMSIFDAAGGKKSAPAQSGCSNGCAVSTAQQKCTVKVAGSYFCRGTAYYTGSACGTSTDSQSLDPSDTSTYPDAQTISDKKPCVYTTGADGAQTCQSETSTEKEGQNCGTYNGQTICADKKPNSDKMKIDTKVSETSNPDGSKVVTKVDVSTKTVCDGVQSCVVTTTTTTTKITKDKEGNTTGSTTQTNTTSGKGGTNDGKGSGAEGEGGEGTEGGGELSTPDLEKTDEFGDSTQKYFNRIKASPIAQAVTGVKFPDGGSCSFRSVTVVYVGTIGFDSFCANATDWLAPLRAVMLAIFGFAALRHLMSA